MRWTRLWGLIEIVDSVLQAGRHQGTPMKLTSKEILKRLGAGLSISQVCQEAGISRTQFDSWWHAETRSRVPDQSGSRRARVRSPVQIERDSLGIPHIFADNDADLFFGFGYALAQDRLF